MAHILVIDDDDSLRTVLVNFLERFGYIVSVATNGMEGLRLFRKEGADIIITDIFMPEADGLEVLLEMSKISRTSARPTPVIAVSGGIRTRNQRAISFLRQAELFGAARIFYKPIDFSGLHSAIQQLLPAGS